jgi:hypothetical protein
MSHKKNSPILSTGRLRTGIGIFANDWHKCPRHYSRRDDYMHLLHMFGRHEGRRVVRVEMT